MRPEVAEKVRAGLERRHQVHDEETRVGVHHMGLGRGLGILWRASFCLRGTTWTYGPPYRGCNGALGGCIRLRDVSITTFGCILTLPYE